MSTPDHTDRRRFLQCSLGCIAAAAMPGFASAEADAPGSPELNTSNLEHPMKTETWFRISLAQWSLHRTIRGGELDCMDFPAHAHDRFGVKAVEYVNSFYGDQRDDPAFPARLRQRAEDAGVESLLIMIDGEGNLGAPDAAERQQAVDNHRRWLDIAKAIGCHSIRVNAHSAGSPDEQIEHCATGMTMLLKHADELELNVLIENHGGHSSNGAWLSSLMRTVDHPRFGTLPDFGNFILDWNTKEEYDRYLGVTELMPYAKAVSAKSNAFDADGVETNTDYVRMLEIVKAAEYRGWIGIEYEGSGHDEATGIELTRDLLLRHGGIL